MVDAMSAQVAFILFESIFCFISAGISASDRAFKKLRFPVTAMNILAAILLAADFVAYVTRGHQSVLSFYLVRTSNFTVFVIQNLILLVYIVFVGIQLFGDFSIKKGAPARIRFMIALMLPVIGVILTIISQFNGMYYIIDADNIYHRGPYNAVAFLPAGIGAVIIATILIQYRKKLGGFIQFIVITSYMSMPVIALCFQIKHYGFSLINIAIGLSILFMFISSSIKTNREVIRIAKTEVRTGLANEHACVEKLNSIHGKPEILDYAVLFFDLVKFSEINHKYGTNTGNLVLVNYGTTLSKRLKEGELLGRQFGNQFVAIVKKSNLEQHIRMIKGLDVKFYDRKSDSEVTEKIASRIGVYEISRQDLNGEEIISYACAALTIAKKQSEGTTVFMTQELMDSLEEKKILEGAVTESLRRGDFIAYYQPKISCEIGSICGMEALSRWDRDGRILTPSVFIPIMEANGTICELDFHILSCVCSDISGWIKEGLKPFPVSVNLSRRNLSNKDLASKIDTIVTSFGIPKDLIEFEITELADEFPISVLKEFVVSIQKLGYKVAIDDFGCASSSLLLLREIAFDTMKIDKGFINNSYEKDKTILENIVDLSKAIGISTVAEGVETKEQLTNLIAMGVNEIQGYYYSKPLPKDEIRKRIEDPGFYISSAGRENG